MSRLFIAFAFAFAGVAACADTLDDRLAELDARVEVDCGYVPECSMQARADEAVACLQNNLAAGIGAKATFELGLDPVEFVYALDGSYVSLAGYYDLYDGPFFTEYTCQAVQTVGSGVCVDARATGCDEVREWND